MSLLVEIITAQEPAQRNRSLDAVCRQLDAAALQAECAALDQFRRSSDNLCRAGRLYTSGRGGSRRCAARRHAASVPLHGQDSKGHSHRGRDGKSGLAR